jgi:hypothetical protein
VNGPPSHGVLYGHERAIDGSGFELSSRVVDMIWKVQLDGDTCDLSQLAKSLTGTDINLTSDGEEYLLTSDRFDGLENARAVRDEAQKIAVVLNGGCRLALNSTQPLKVCGVYRCHPGGGRDVFVFPEPAVFCLRAISPTVKITRAAGVVEVHHPADPVRQWAIIALSCVPVADVFRLLSSGRLDWVNLYRIIEIIADEMGSRDAIVEKGWASRDSMRLFKRTANSPGALGLQARHGVERTQPPSKPMLLSEAQSLVVSVIHAWLRDKT